RRGLSAICRTIYLRAHIRCSELSGARRHRRGSTSDQRPLSPLLCAAADISKIRLSPPPRPRESRSPCRGFTGKPTRSDPYGGHPATGMLALTQEVSMRSLRRRAAVATTVAAGLVTIGGTLVAVTAQAATSGCSVSYTVSSQWPGGFGANVAITNLGSPISGWSLAWSFSAGQSITQLWNGTYTQSGANVTVTNVSYNGSLGTGASTSFGFNGSWNNSSNPTPASFSLNGVTCTGGVTSGSPSSTPSTSPTPPPPGQGVCDIFAAGGTPCVAAHSTTRALYSTYSGALYQVRRSSDNTTRDIGVVSAGGVADAASQDSFCAGTSCVITIIYDQSGRHNNLTQAPAGGAAPGPDNLANATGAPTTLNG